MGVTWRPQVGQQRRDGLGGHQCATGRLAGTYSHLWPDSNDRTSLWADESVDTPGSVIVHRYRHASDGHPSWVLVAEHL